MPEPDSVPTVPPRAAAAVSMTDRLKRCMTALCVTAAAAATP